MTGGGNIYKVEFIREEIGVRTDRVDVRGYADTSHRMVGCADLLLWYCFVSIHGRTLGDPPGTQAWSHDRLAREKTSLTNIFNSPG